MKNLFIKPLSIIILLIVWIACGESSEQNSTTTSDSPTSHPLGQASVEDNVSEKNILQVAVSSEDHSTLVAAVQAAQIEHILVNAGPLTVFAPTNEAFDALPVGTVNDLLKPENKGKLASLLTKHAAPGSYDQEALQREANKGRRLYMATGDYLEIVLEGSEIRVGGAKVIGTIETSNGIINVVDQVIL